MSTPVKETPFVEAFWCDSWMDESALTAPYYSPRGFRTAGPFATFKEAVDHTPKNRPEASHFKVRKMYVQPDFLAWAANAQAPVIRGKK